MKYKHLFFDLDHTLWDFDKNSTETLTELYYLYHLETKGIPDLETFIKVYLFHNELMWEQYRYGKIDRETLRNNRFEYVLYDFEIENKPLAIELSQEYIIRSPRKTNLFEDAHEVLTYLKENYVLHIITNGFRETQFIKMNSTNITPYFSEIILSEEVGFKKPDPEIFHYSMNKAGTNAAESLMIGDNLDVDIAGARYVNMDQVYFNPNKIPHRKETTFEINSLKELKEFL